MSLRREVTCTLVAHGVDERALVPPAIFHTLIENGLTHLLPCDGRQDFGLWSERSGNETRYTLLAQGRLSLALPNGESPSVERSGQENSSFKVPAKEGTGLRYIKARLEESFTGNWTMTGGAVSGGWETVIVLQQANQATASLRRGSADAVLVKENPA